MRLEIKVTFKECKHPPLMSYCGKVHVNNSWFDVKKCWHFTYTGNMRSKCIIQRAQTSPTTVLVWIYSENKGWFHVNKCWHFTNTLNIMAAIVYVSFRERKHLPTDLWTCTWKERLIICNWVLKFKSVINTMRPTMCVSFKECKHPPPMYGFIHMNKGWFYVNKCWHFRNT